MYDITNKWSFEGINRWLKEVDEHAPGVPKVLVGNRLHLAFKRQVAAKSAESYASRHKMSCFEISPLCDFNIRESFCELARMALHRNGMERIWRTNRGELFLCMVAGLLLSCYFTSERSNSLIGVMKQSSENSETNLKAHQNLLFSLFFFFISTVLSLQELCCRTIVRRMRSVYSIDTLPLPNPVKSHLKSYALTTTTSAICPNNNILVNTAKNITCKSHHNNKFSAKNHCSVS